MPKIPDEVTYAVYEPVCLCGCGAHLRRSERLPSEAHARAVETAMRESTNHAKSALVIVKETISREYVAGHEGDGK